jgi:hypothetical protein
VRGYVGLALGLRHSPCPRIPRSRSPEIPSAYQPRFLMDSY